MKTFKKDELTVNIFDTRAEMGAAAAAAVAEEINRQLAVKPELNMIFAAAPSQNELLAGLVELGKKGVIDFTRINAFHMDEYIGLAADAPQGFGNFLRDRLFGLVPFKSVQYIDCSAADAAAECARYARLLTDNPCDIICMGIGENGHIAFNDPHVAFFDDPEVVKAVELDQKCRMQQVHDGCFAALDEVPTHALTPTIPTLVRPEAIFCIVPAAAKAEAVKGTVEGPVTEACPASILRTRKDASLWLDADSASLLEA